MSSHPGAHLVGASWLYNLPAYRRIFPQSYLDRLKPIDPPYQRMPLWGQFLDRDGKLRADSAQMFRTRLSTCTHLQDLGSCFPLQVPSTTAPVAWLLEQISNAEGEGE